MFTYNKTRQKPINTGLAFPPINKSGNEFEKET